MQSATALLEQGGELMLFGMGTVFVFLALLVVCTSLMSSLLQRYMPEAAPASRSAAKPAAATRASVDANTVAVISAALHQHRKRK